MSARIMDTIKQEPRLDTPTLLSDHASQNQRILALKLTLQGKGSLLSQTWMELNDLLSEYQAHLFDKEDKILNSSRKYDEYCSVERLKCDLAMKENEICELKLTIKDLEKRNRVIQMDNSVKESLLKQYQQEMISRELERSAPQSSSASAMSSMGAMSEGTYKLNRYLDATPWEQVTVEAESSSHSVPHHVPQTSNSVKDHLNLVTLPETRRTVPRLNPRKNNRPRPLVNNRRVEVPLSTQRSMEPVTSNKLLEPQPIALESRALTLTAPPNQPVQAVLSEVEPVAEVPVPVGPVISVEKTKRGPPTILKRKQPSSGTTTQSTPKRHVPPPIATSTPLVPTTSAPLSPTDEIKNQPVLDLSDPDPLREALKESGLDSGQLDTGQFETGQLDTGLDTLEDDDEDDDVNEPLYARQLKEEAEATLAEALPGYEFGMTSQSTDVYDAPILEMTTRGKPQCGPKSHPCQCHVCGSTFFSGVSLAIHVRQHYHTQHLCRYCDLDFATDDALSAHLNAICPHCGARFACKRKLGGHESQCRKHPDRTNPWRPKMVMEKYPMF